MNNKETFDFHVKHGLIKQEYDVNRVEKLANILIDSLFKPTKKDSITAPDWSRIKKENINRDEPINWGDLNANVVKKEGLFIVTIDEASPGECQSLCEYVERYLNAWGWPVIAETEW